MLIDITQELFHCRVYPGDPKPERIRLLSLENGDSCSLTGLRMCAHNGTHADAPCHFVPNGKTIDEMGLEPFVGDCFVARHEGDVLASDADSILRRAADAGAAQRILIAGKATVTEEAAGVFASAKLLLLGNESQTVGPEDAPRQVHLILLGAECVPMDYDAIPAAIAAGEIDGAEDNVLAMFDYIGDLGYLIYDDHVRAPRVVVISNAALARLDDAQQAVLREKAEELCEYYKAFRVGYEDEGRAEAQKALGAELVRKVDREAFRAACAPVYDALRESGSPVAGVVEQLLALQK